MIDKLVVKLLTLKMWLSDEHGQDVLEYAVLSGTIAILVIGAATLFGEGVDAWFDKLTVWFGTIGP